MISRVLSLLQGLEEIDSFETSAATDGSQPNVAANDETWMPQQFERIFETSEKVRAVFMTLHFVFPHETLPALDLLDRRLIERVTVSENVDTHDLTDDHVFYIQSASGTQDSRTLSSETTSSRFRNAWDPKGRLYEVRLDSWNCTCPAFAYSTLKLLADATFPNDDSATSTWASSSRLGNVWRFGGTATNPSAVAPICKHILAALVVTAAPNFCQSMCVNQMVSLETMAALAAGWNTR